MNKPKQNSKGDINKSPAYDRCQTPPYALDPLLPYLKPEWIVWEPASGEGVLADALLPHVKQVIATDLLAGYNFFTEPFRDCDVMITNPPYAVKYQWHEHCVESEIPFALLVPLEMIGAARAFKLMKVYGAEIILLNKRVDFKMLGHTWKESCAQFPVIWLTRGLNIGSPLTYAEINKPTKTQLEFVDQFGWSILNEN